MVTAPGAHSAACSSVVLGSQSSRRTCRTASTPPPIRWPVVPKRSNRSWKVPFIYWLIQTYLSQRMLLAEARAVYPQVATPAHLYALYRQGDTFAKAMMNQVGEYAAIAVNLLANTYAPEVVLLCGSMIRQGTVLQEIVEDMYQEKLNQYMKGTFQLRFERFGTTGHAGVATWG